MFNLLDQIYYRKDLPWSVHADPQATVAPPTSPAAQIQIWYRPRVALRSTPLALLSTRGVPIRLGALPRVALRSTQLALLSMRGVPIRLGALPRVALLSTFAARTQFRLWTRKVLRSYRGVAVLLVVRQDVLVDQIQIW